MTIEETLTPAVKPSSMKFVDAISRIIEGKKVTRVSWDNKDYCFMKDGWLTIYTKGDFHAWSINDGDMESNDWIITMEDN